MIEHSIARFPEDVADHVLFCIPPGTGSWVANAVTGHWRSQYNDYWCMSLSAVMHEVRVDKKSFQSTIDTSIKLSTSTIRSDIILD